MILFFLWIGVFEYFQMYSSQVKRERGGNRVHDFSNFPLTLVESLNWLNRPRDVNFLKFSSLTFSPFSINLDFGLDWCTWRRWLYPLTVHAYTTRVQSAKPKPNASRSSTLQWFSIMSRLLLFAIYLLPLAPLLLLLLCILTGRIIYHITFSLYLWSPNFLARLDGAALNFNYRQTQRELVSLQGWTRFVYIVVQVVVWRFLAI